MEAQAERAVKQACTRSELSGTATTLSTACEKVLKEQNTAFESFGMLSNFSRTEPRDFSGKHSIQLMRSAVPTFCGNGVDQPCCDYQIGPSPICRALIMNDCDCGPGGNCGSSICCAKKTYDCSWWNWFCWGVCGDSSGVQYCGYCGVPFP